MPYQILESLVVGKYGDPNLCEDRLICSGHFVAVVDGTTSKSAWTIEGKSTGWMAGELIENVILNLSPTAALHELAAELEKAFISFYKLYGKFEHVTKHPVDRLSASLVVFSVQRSCVWLIGDCQALIDGRYFTIHKKVDDLLAETRAMVIAGFLAQGGKEEELFVNDIGRAHILELLKWQSYLQNSKIDSPYAFGVVDGFPVQPSHMAEIPLHGARELVLASDGYPNLLPTLEESELDLMHLLEVDPLCYKQNKTTKGKLSHQVSFDDRAYVRLALK